MKGLATGTLIKLWNGEWEEIQDIDPRMAVESVTGEKTYVERRVYQGVHPVFEFLTPVGTTVKCTPETELVYRNGAVQTPYESGYDVIDAKKVPVYHLECTPHN